MRKLIRKLYTRRKNARLYSDLRHLSKTSLKNRLKEEGYSLSKESLKNAAEMYADMLFSDVAVSTEELIDKDMSNLKDIFSRINSKYR